MNTSTYILLFSPYPFKRLCSAVNLERYRGRRNDKLACRQERRETQNAWYRIPMRRRSWRHHRKHHSRICDTLLWFIISYRWDGERYRERKKIFTIRYVIWIQSSHCNNVLRWYKMFWASNSWRTCMLSCILDKSKTRTSCDIKNEGKWATCGGSMCKPRFSSHCSRMNVLDTMRLRFYFSWEVFQK